MATDIYAGCSCELLVRTQLIFPILDITLPTMRTSRFGAGALLTLTAGTANAQFPPKPEGLKVLESRFGDGVTISYKEVR
jgi:hypothetical protein